MEPKDILEQMIVEYCSKNPPQDDGKYMMDNTMRLPEKYILEKLEVAYKEGQNVH